MLNVGIIGCGNIGRIIGDRVRRVKITAVFDKDPDRAKSFGKSFGGRACADFPEFLAQDIDVVVEAASVAAVKEYASSVLQSARDLVVLSVGGLIDAEFRQSLEQMAMKQAVRIHIPSGAIMGLDAIRIGVISNLTRLTLVSRKPPAGFGVEVEEPTLLFSGPASQCIAQFPRNVNVAAALSIAAGMEAAVEIWADPAVSTNTHEIVFEGDFGRGEIKVSNVPCPDNPRTSYLAALSVLALLENLDRPLILGA